MSFSLNSWERLQVIGKTLVVQLALFAGILGTVWGAQALYAVVDPVSFPNRFAVPSDASSLSEHEKGKLLLDSITNQMRYELDSSLGWTCNDLLFNKYMLDNRAYRQHGVYYATKQLIDLYSMHIAKLGSNDRESNFLYRARLNDFSIDPTRFWFPSAEGRYADGLKKCEEYKASLDKGTGVYNARTDDLHLAFRLLVSENMFGYALGLLQNSQSLPFYTLDNRIYEVQGMMLVIRDFVSTLYQLYPEIHKNNRENMAAAMDYLDKICTYDPFYITPKFNSGELIVAHLIFAKNRLQDIMDSIRI